MTREEAIQWLKTAQTSPLLYGEYAEALSMAIKALEEPNIMDYLHIGKIPKACQSCRNHPSNGGSGICHCTLGNNIRW